MTVNVEQEIQPDKLERLAEMANDDIAKDLARLRDAVEACSAERSFSNAVAVANRADDVARHFNRRNAFRTHSDSWRSRPGTGPDGSRTSDDVISFDS